jgi:hypothetical protein
VTGAAPSPASGSYELHVGRGAATWSEDPRTFVLPLTRQAFRDLPLEHMICLPCPSLDRPVLVFDERHRADANYWRAELEDPERKSLRTQYQKAKANVQRAQGDAAQLQKAMGPLKRIIREVRKFHARRVRLAIGYTWPGNPPGWIEFADD